MENFCDTLLENLFSIEKRVDRQGRNFNAYLKSDIWGTFSERTFSNGMKTWPSAMDNHFVDSIKKWQSSLHTVTSDISSSIHLTVNELTMCRQRGKNAWQSMYDSTCISEAPGMQAIRLMVKCITHLTQSLNIKLEPFQLETIRGCVFSRAVRLLNHDLMKYAPSILEMLGIIGNVELQTMDVNMLQKMFLNYCKKFVAVVAPRRNGKSKSGKIFVAVNAVCEEGSVIVLLAHQINAVLLYKDDILRYLQILLGSGLVSFKIRNNLHSIRIEYDDIRKKSSIIYFVAGGHNVSIMFQFSHFVLNRSYE